LNSKVLALIWDYFCFYFHLIYMAKAGFSFEIKTFRSSLYAGAKRYNSFPLEWEP
jgi:hypothetical protein